MHYNNYIILTLRGNPEEKFKHLASYLVGNFDKFRLQFLYIFVVAEKCDNQFRTFEHTNTFFYNKIL